MYFISEVFILGLFIINVIFIFYTKNNIATWFLYNTVCVILPLLMIVLVTKKNNKDKYKGLKIVFLLLVSLIFSIVILGSILFREMLFE